MTGNHQKNKLKEFPNVIKEFPNEIKEFSNEIKEFPKKKKTKLHLDPDHELRQEVHFTFLAASRPKK